MPKHYVFMLTVQTNNGPKATTLTIPVTILANRTAFGREDFQVEPIGGKGKAWVSREKLSPDPHTVSEYRPKA
jgi:hypothetical protein